MFNRSFPFNAALILFGAVYWWLIGWFAQFWVLLASWIIGRERFTHIEQAMVLRIPPSGTSGMIIFGFHSLLMLVFDILAVIPLYLMWALWYRRRDNYPAHIAGPPNDA